MKPVFQLCSSAKRNFKFVIIRFSARQACIIYSTKKATIIRWNFQHHNIDYVSNSYGVTTLTKIHKQSHNLSPYQMSCDTLQRQINCSNYKKKGTRKLRWNHGIFFIAQKAIRIVCLLLNTWCIKHLDPKLRVARVASLPKLPGDNVYQYNLSTDANKLCYCVLCTVRLCSNKTGKVLNLKRWRSRR
jgi:hypothetical protein